MKGVSVNAEPYTSNSNKDWFLQTTTTPGDQVHQADAPSKLNPTERVIIMPNCSPHFCRCFESLIRVQDIHGASSGRRWDDEGNLRQRRRRIFDLYEERNVGTRQDIQISVHHEQNRVRRLLWVQGERGSQSWVIVNGPEKFSQGMPDENLTEFEDLYHIIIWMQISHELLRGHDTEVI